MDSDGDSDFEESMVDVEDVSRYTNERLINDEYEYWERLAPLLCDFVITHEVEWPSMTVEWLPYCVQSLDGCYTFQKIIIGNHTANGEPNYLIIAKVRLPNDEVYGVGCKIELIRRIPHDGSVLRARHMPQDPFVIATKTTSSEVHIFDYKNHPAMPPIGGTSNPDLRLTGHSIEGFGLSWSTINRGSILSGSDDSKICLWDIDQAPLNKGVIDALQTFEVHEGAVEDVAWHLRHRHLFGSCGEDQYLHIYDLRSPCTRPAQSTFYQSEIQCLSFNPFNEWLVAMGSSDTAVKCYDLRRLTRPLHSFDHHLGAVLQVGWSPHRENILSSSGDRQVMIWNTNRIGIEQSQAEAEYGPPELVYTHGGHTDTVVDFSWNPSEDRMIASVSENNIFQVWKTAEHIYNDF